MRHQPETAGFDGDRQGNAHTRIETEHGVFTIDSATPADIRTRRTKIWSTAVKYTDDSPSSCAKGDEGRVVTLHVTINVTGGAGRSSWAIPNAIMAEITEAGVVPNT